jgi:hypothetical protein
MPDTNHAEPVKDRFSLKLRSLSEALVCSRSTPRDPVMYLKLRESVVAEGGPPCNVVQITG